MKSLVVRFLFAGEGEKYGKITIIIIIHFAPITLTCHDSIFLPRDYHKLGVFQQLFNDFDMDQLSKMKERGIR